MASVIFYFLVVHWKNVQDRDHLLPLLTSKTATIIGSAEAVVGLLEREAGYNFDSHYPSQTETEAMCSRVLAHLQLNWGPPFDVEISTYIQYLRFQRRNAKDAVASLYTVMPYLDSEFVRLLAAIDDCPYFGALERADRIILGDGENLRPLAFYLYQYSQATKRLLEYRQSKGFGWR